jgi:antitoxin component YwqK of YwqJK toxin-antitoxin module
MQNLLDRPAAVPENATYDAELEGWAVVQKDGHGRRAGEALTYREDGSLQARSYYREGVLDGPFAAFHPNGQLAREGRYSLGKLDGEVVAYRSDAPTPLSLRGCCVPAEAWQLRSLYRDGRLTRQVFYDRDGRPMTSEGALWPERPAAVPEQADFDELSARWRLRSEREDSAHVDAYFGRDGARVEETEYRAGKASARRRFGEANSIVEECHYGVDGRLNGPRVRRFAAGQAPYADPRVREERATFEQGVQVGSLDLLDAGGNVLARVECGARLGADWRRGSPVFDTALDDASAERLWAMVETLRDEGRVREALGVAGRAAARAGRREELEALLRAVTPPLTLEVRADRGRALLAARDVDVARTLDELLLGTDAADVYRTLASLAVDTGRAALDLVAAALLLAPERPMTRLTRALARLDVGEPAGALEDAEALAAASPESAEFLRESVRVLYGGFPFRPSAQSLPAPPSDAPEMAPEQPVAEVQRQIRVYATRLALRRERVRALSRAPSDAAWLPPDTAWLLSDGPVELRQTTATIEDETDEGFERTEVSIDEGTDLDGGAMTLMRGARADWAALCWLCWGVGLDRVAMPDTVAAPADFAAAVYWAIERRFRARDRLTTGGLVSRTRGVPGFEWEGVHIDAMDSIFASMAADEFLEIRSVFLWLSWKENISPFQSDIRNG